jgi:hypothetical protein
MKREKDDPATAILGSIPLIGSDIYGQEIQRGEEKEIEGGGDRYIHLSRSIRKKTDILHILTWLLQKQQMKNYQNMILNDIGPVS